MARDKAPKIQIALRCAYPVGLEERAWASWAGNKEKGKHVATIDHYCIQRTVVGRTSMVCNFIVSPLQTHYDLLLIYKAKKESTMTNTKFIFPKSPDLNYKWITAIYVLACTVAVGLYALEMFGSRPQNKWVANLNGAYIAFAPYFPCLLWVLMTRIIRSESDSEQITDKKKDQ